MQSPLYNTQLLLQVDNKLKFKRVVDVVASFFLLILLAPLMLIIACLIKCHLGAPLLFRQTRPGKAGKLFEIIKFRTMLDPFDNKGKPLPEAERLPRLGKWLRATSLDELPELWNVLKGDMSLIGPRPLLVDYLPLYNEEQSRRHEVLPGITGWAQVNGRNALSWEEKFKLDLWYVEHYSFWLDLKIVFLTIKKVLIQEGISIETHVSAYPFTGNKPNES